MKLTKAEISILCQSFEYISDIGGLTSDESDLYEKLKAENDKPTDYSATIELLTKNDIGFHTSKLYSTEDNSLCGRAVWLSMGGHIEFDLDGKIKNIVTF